MFIERLDHKKINQLLSQDVKQLVDISIVETVNSTNDYLKQTRHNKPINICLAEQQTHGRGRLNRSWYSPFGKNIYFSCLYKFCKNTRELASLSLVVGLAIIKTFRKYGVKNKLFIKWPNDVIWDNQKLAGDLIEIETEKHNSCDAIIGIGINVNMLDVEEGRISQPWTSLRAILNKTIDRNYLAASLIYHLIDYIKQFECHGFSQFLDEWAAYDYLLGQFISITNNIEEFEGKMVGVNQDGHLLLQLQNGTTRAFSSGELSLR